MKTTTLAERFWEKVAIADGCWEWTGCKIPGGYGQVWFEGRMVNAHRAAVFVATGAMPPAGSVVLHRCDNRSCVRPEHLQVGTAADNVADMIAKGRNRNLRGEQVKGARLKADQVRRMRFLVDAGMPVFAAAEIYGVHETHVRDICARRRWAHIA